MQASAQQSEENEIDREYKAEAVSNRFKQQMSYGVGAAMVFGLFSAGAKMMFDSAATATATSGFLTSTAFLMPALGLAALAVVGIGALYLSANFLSKGMLLDNEMQARKIQQVKQKAMEVASPVVEIEKPAQTFPQTIPDIAEEAAPQADTKWSGRFEKSNGSIADLATKATSEDKSWGDKVKSAEQAADKQLAAL